MKLLILVIAAVVAVGAQQRVDLIDGIRIEGGAATTPLSERVIMRPFSGAIGTVAGGTITPTGAALPAGAGPTPTSDLIVIVEGVNLLLDGVAGEIQLALAPPGIECSALAGAPAVCDNRGTSITAPQGCRLPTVGTPSVTQRAFSVPTAIITQGSLRYADKVCILGDSRQTGAAWWDTQLRYQVAIPCVADGTLPAQASSSVPSFPTLAAPGTAAVFPTDCRFTATLSVPLVVQSLVFRTGVREDSTGTNSGDQIDWDLADRRARTRCCGWRATGALEPVTGAVLTSRVGYCFDPNVQACCSGATDQRKQIGNVTSVNIAGTGKLINKFTEKCCHGGNRALVADDATGINTRTGGFAPMIRLLDQPCPCLSSATNLVTEFCQDYEGCCRSTKYPEITSQIGSTLTSTSQFGSCYDPRRMGCCDTGAVFNSGTQQCCKISGVQSLDVPCPCSNNSHCDFTQLCCKPSTPSASESQLEGRFCNIYTNFFAGSVGTAGYGQDTWATAQGINNRCLGQCLDPRFSICCNGNACVGAYERCCNSTCCNKKTQSCVMGQKKSIGGRFNDQNTGVFYEICTTVEALTPMRAVLAFFVPIMLLFVTLTGLAFTLYFSKKQNALNPLSAYEKAIVTVAFLVILFAWPLFFSPLYKYGVIAIWFSFFSILAATCGVKRLLPVALLLQVALLVYIFDPFGGNEILNLGYTQRGSALFALNAGASGIPGAQSVDSGLFLAIMNLWKSKSCLPFYGYWFTRDPMVEDQQRLDFNGAKTTFGYCSREYIGALMIVEILMSMWVIVLTVLTLVAFIKNLLISKVVKQNPFHM